MVLNNVKGAQHKAADAAAADSGPAPSSQAGPSRGKKVTKRNTDARKEQNRNASRAYRERRKQRLALLGQLLDRDQVGKHPSGKLPYAPRLEEVVPPAETCQPVVDHGPPPPSSPSPAAATTTAGNVGGQSASLMCEDLSFDSPWPVPLNDSLSSYVRLRAAAASESLPRAAGSPALGLPSSPPIEPALGGVPFVTSQHPQTPQSQPLDVGRLPQPQSLSWSDPPSRQTASSFSALGQLLQLLDEQPAFQDDNGSRSTSSSSSNTYRNTSSTSARSPASSSSSSLVKSTAARDESLGAFMEYLKSLRTPTLQRAIYVQQNSLYAAIMDNTFAIGCLQGMQLMLSEDGTSPFFHKDFWTAASSKSTSGSSRSQQQQVFSQIRSQFAFAPKALQPVDEQITMDHHIYLDVLPFPSFRQRALVALAQDPPLFDEDEMCFDLTIRNGLVVWGSRGNDDRGMEAGRPWDMRSWEPQPWFLRKYWFLVGGWDDDMWKAARWWHAMRNERIGRAPAR